MILVIIYCCVRGCVCPCACTCCDKKEEENEKSQLKYEVTDSPRGMTNEAYQPDLVETGSQRPLYEKYLPEDKLARNPASWYENSYTRELHKPNRKGADYEVSQVQQKTVINLNLGFLPHRCRRRNKYPTAQCQCAS